MERFGLSDAQAQAIVDMRLKTLTGLEREKLENEYKDLMAQITELRQFLQMRKNFLQLSAQKFWKLQINMAMTEEHRSDTMSLIFPWKI